MTRGDLAGLVYVYGYGLSLSLLLELTRRWRRDPIAIRGRFARIRSRTLDLGRPTPLPSRVAGDRLLYPAERASPDTGDLQSTRPRRRGHTRQYLLRYLKHAAAAALSPGLGRGQSTRLRIAEPDLGRSCLSPHRQVCWQTPVSESRQVKLSIEGSCAGVISTFAAVAVTLHLPTRHPLALVLIGTLIAAMLQTALEVISTAGSSHLSVPLGIALTLFWLGI